MSLRLATMEDLETVYDICLSIKEVYKKQNLSLWNDYYPLIENFKEDISNNGLYVYELDNQIIGSISVSDNLEELIEAQDYVKWLFRFMVKPHLQSQGLGSKMMRELEIILRSQGVREIKFLVSNLNPKAMKLYLRDGCSNLGYFKTPWEEDGEFYYLLSKKISE